MEVETKLREVCPTKTQGWVKKGALLVDIREANEVDALAFDVPRILNIPLSEFEERYTEIPKDEYVVIVDTNGSKTLLAANFLQNNGYDHVLYMKRGLVKWVQKGFPTKGDTSAVQDGSSCCSSSSCC